MHFLFTQRPGTWHLYCHVAVLTVQYLLLLPLRLCVDVWTSSGAWYLSVWASLMIWRAIWIKPSHCLRPEIWSNLVTLSLLSQICFSQYKWWMFLKNMFQGFQVICLLFVQNLGCCYSAKMEPRDYMSELWFCRFKSEGFDLSLREFMFMLLEFYCRICSECIHLEVLHIYISIWGRNIVQYSPLLSC